MAKAATKTYPLRLDQGIAEELEFVATVDGMTVAAEVRQAIVAHLERLKGDAEFQERLRMSRERDQDLYERLSAEVQQY
jgi:predicted DNA-binding protein